MALIVPNATATGSSNKYSSINQAEPDSVDFESLGNTLNYVRSGFVVTVGAFNSVSITAGVAVINGIPYSAASVTPFTVNPGSATRFDLLVVRLSGSTATITLLPGTENSVNPTLPQSKSTLASGSGTSANYDPTTDALIATIYTAPSTSLTSSGIVDKRIISVAPLTYAVSGVPTSSAKDVIGDTAIYNGDSYIKNTSSTWAKLTTTTEVEAAKIAIGGMFPFAGTYNTTYLPDTAVYLECNGQLLSKSNNSNKYLALFNAIGYSFGGSGDSFNLPNLTGDTSLTGASVSDIEVRTVGENTVAVVLPEHKHTYTTVIGNKTGSTNVGPKTGHPPSATTVSGTIIGDSHTHRSSGGVGNSGTLERFVTISTVSSGSTVTNITDWHGEIPFYFDTNYHNGLVTYFKEADKSTGANVTGGTTSVTIPTSLAISTDIGTVSITTPIGNPTGTTDNFGTSNATMSTLSKSIRVRWFIRYA